MDIANYSSDSRAVIKNAREIAQSFRHPEIEVEHMLIATIRQEGSQVESILNQLGKSASFVESMTELYLKDQSSRATARDNVAASPAVQEVLARAIEEKNKLYDALVEPEHIFIAIFDPKSKLAPYLREKLDVTKEGIYRAIAESKAVEDITTTAPGDKPAGEAETKKVSGTLRYCIDLTNQAAAGEFDPVIGRDKEIQQVMQILLRRRKNSPVLVGGPGVGKTAIVEGFAQAVIAGEVPKALEKVKVMELDMGAMVAGAKYKGEFEERLKTLIGEVIKTAGQIVMFIDEVHTIVGPGGGGGTDAANLLKPALARGQIRLIGATTEEEYTKHLEKDKALERRFEKVLIEEPNFDNAVRIIRGVATKYQDHHKIEYTPEALVAAVKFAQRYLSERNLPDVALDIIDEAGSEFGVKEEFAKKHIPELEAQGAEVQKLMAACKGKTQETDGEAFDELWEAYDAFTQKVDMLDLYWGHRVEAQTGEVE